VTSAAVAVAVLDACVAHDADGDDTDDDDASAH